MAGSAFRTLSMPKVCVEEIKYSGKPFSFAAPQPKQMPFGAKVSCRDFLSFIFIILIQIASYQNIEETAHEIHEKTLNKEKKSFFLVFRFFRMFRGQNSLNLYIRQLVLFQLKIH